MGTGAAFGDYDGDGWPIFLSRTTWIFISMICGVRSGKSCKYLGLDVQCGPRGLKGLPDNLYHNNGDGTFTDISKKTGVDDPNAVTV